MINESFQNHIKVLLKTNTPEQLKTIINNLIDSLYDEQTTKITQLPPDIGPLIARYLTPSAIKRFTTANKAIPGRDIIIESVKEIDNVFNWINEFDIQERDKKFINIKDTLDKFIVKSIDTIFYQNQIPALIIQSRKIRRLIDTTEEYDMAYYYILSSINSKLKFFIDNPKYITDNYITDLLKYKNNPHRIISERLWELTELYLLWTKPFTNIKSHSFFNIKDAIKHTLDTFNQFILIILHKHLSISYNFIKSITYTPFNNNVMQAIIPKTINYNTLMLSNNDHLLPPIQQKDKYAKGLVKTFKSNYKFIHLNLFKLELNFESLDHIREANDFKKLFVKTFSKFEFMKIIIDTINQLDIWSDLAKAYCDFIEEQLT